MATSSTCQLVWTCATERSSLTAWQASGLRVGFRHARGSAGADRLQPESPVRRQPMRLAYRRLLVLAGSGIVEACHCSCRNLFLEGICRSQSEKRLDFCELKMSVCGR